MEPFSDLRSLQHGSSNVPTPTYYLPPPFPGGSARANTLHITTHRLVVRLIRGADSDTDLLFRPPGERCQCSFWPISGRDLSSLPPINQESPPAFGPSPGATSVRLPCIANCSGGKVHPDLLEALSAKSVPAPGREPVLGGAQPTARRDLGRRHRPCRPPGEHC